MLHELLDCAYGQILLELQWLDHRTCLRENVGLNEAFVGIESVPVFSDRHAHESVELLSTRELGREFLDPVLGSELFVSIFPLVYLHSFQLGVFPLLLQLGNLLLAHLVGLDFESFETTRVNAITSPRIPALFDFFHGHCFSQVSIDFFLLLLLEVGHRGFFLSHKETFEDLLFFCLVRGVFY